MFDDFYIANCCYAELLGISKEHFNYLERVFVQLLEYDLTVTTEEYKTYCSHMRDFILDTFWKQKQMAENAQEPEQSQIPPQIPSQMPPQMPSQMPPQMQNPVQNQIIN